MAKYNIGGFTFTDENSAKAAAKELKAVDYILTQLKDADDATVLKLYNKLVSQNMFSTPVGLSFMNQLKSNLVGSGLLTENPLNETNKNSEESHKKSESKKVLEKTAVKSKAKNKSKISFIKKAKSSINENKSRIQTKDEDDILEIKHLRRVNKILLVLSITLGLCVLGMFYVNSTINSPNILNYEEEILNKYSSWEQDLESREQALREKERSLE